MASAPYLDHYLDRLENLPDELQRNMTLMRDLDSTAQEVMRYTDKLADDYLSNVKRYSVEQKKETLTTIQRQFDRAKEYGDDKVQLAVQTYEMVDKHIRNLDADLLRFEAEIQDRAINAVRNVEEGSQKRRRKKTKEKEIKKKSAANEEESVAIISKKKPLKKGGAKMTNAAPSKTSLVSVVTNPTKPTNNIASIAVETSSLTGVLVGAGVAHSAEVLDMPVDPNEPTYCLCNQVSYGEMIGCDNPDCPIEWFHFACVKLITKPKGKWFCPKCITDKKKK